MRRIRQSIATYLVGSVPRWWVLLWVAVSGGCAVGWWFALRPSEPVWGDVATWATAFGTAGAVIYAARQLTHAQRQAASGAHQARLALAELRDSSLDRIALSVGQTRDARGESMRWRLENGSQQVIFNVRVAAVSDDVEQFVDGFSRIESSDYRDGLIKSDSVGEVLVTFRDPWGEARIIRVSSNGRELERSRAVDRITPA